jgi:hypothetical protein
VNLEGNDVILNSTVDARTFFVLNTTVLPPPSPPISPPQETNKILTNLVNLLQQQNNRLERVEKNQEKILTEVAMQIEEAKRNKRHTTPLAVEDTISIPLNCRKGGKKPPDDSNGGSSCPTSQRSCRDLRTATKGRILPCAKVVERRRIILRSATIGGVAKDLSPGR